MAILTTPKKRAKDVVLPTQSREGRVGGQDKVVEPAPNLHEARIGRNFGFTITNIISSEECFQDAPQEWIGLEETKRGEQVYMKERMIVLLENIDRLVDKEKEAEHSPDKERKECAQNIKDLEYLIDSSSKAS